MLDERRGDIKLFGKLVKFVLGCVAALFNFDGIEVLFLLKPPDIFV